VYQGLSNKRANLVKEQERRLVSIEQDLGMLAERLEALESVMGSYQERLSDGIKGFIIEHLRVQSKTIMKETSAVLNTRIFKLDKKVEDVTKKIDHLYKSKRTQMSWAKSRNRKMLEEEKLRARSLDDTPLHNLPHLEQEVGKWYWPDDMSAQDTDTLLILKAWTLRTGHTSFKRSDVVHLFDMKKQQVSYRLLCLKKLGVLSSYRKSRYYYWQQQFMEEEEGENIE
jgi:hypothetical protein